MFIYARQNELVSPIVLLSLRLSKFSSNFTILLPFALSPRLEGAIFGSSVGGTEMAIGK